MPSFCSDIIVHNLNLFSLPAFKVLCSKKHNYVSPMKCFMLQTSPFVVTPSTRLPSSSPLSTSSSPSSLSPLSPLSLTSPSSSLSPSPSVSFSTSLASEVCVSPSYLNTSVFCLTICFFIIYLL